MNAWQVRGHNRSKALASLVSRQPCNSSLQPQVPICQTEAKKELGEWHTAKILVDHIALEAGFAKQPYQAQCLTAECGETEWKFVHVTKNIPWFLAAVGGPQCKRGTLQSVLVIDTLASTVFGKTDWGLHADRSCGECGESEDRRDGECGENEEEDPMSILMDVSEPAWETPKKKSMKQKREPQRSMVRAIDMPKRPLCVGGAAGDLQKVYVFVRPGSKALWVRIDCIDWLTSYAADELYYQGVARVAAAASKPAEDYELHYHYPDKAFDCKINVGVDAGLTWRMNLDQLTKDLYLKLREKELVDECWSQANRQVKRSACRQYLNLLCRATVDGSRPAFDEEWSCATSAKKQKIGFDCETAVAESQPSPSDDNAENDGGDAWLPTEQPAAALAATAVAAAECSLGGACQAASDDSQ